jgi:two-component system, NtrC family, sensor histidine kinase HydH
MEGSSGGRAGIKLILDRVIDPATGEPQGRIELSDRGPGIPPDKKTAIFMPYYSTEGRSSGLGLTIVKSIVQTHNGSIEECGEWGKGARFILRFPLSDGPH